MQISDKSTSKLHQLRAVSITVIKEIGPVAFIGLAGSLILLSLFVWLVQIVFGPQAARVDHDFAVWAQSITNPFFNAFFDFFTIIGGFAGVIVLTILTFGWLLVFKKHSAAWLVVLAVSGGIILNQVLKFYFERPRPELFLSAVTHPSNYSFPSGHATVSMCYFGVLIWLGWHFFIQRALRIGWTILMLLFIACVGLSRLYFGVHYPTDVIGGYLAGSFWLITLLNGTNLYRRLRKPFVKPT